jgi:hypothetical protein
VSRARQLWLFPPGRPLLERFGPAYFRSLPDRPGVYFFYDGAGRLLYVGKAKSLRMRLGSYRYAHPDRNSRKTWRLVHAVCEIRWEVCPDHAAALLRENRLLRELRPPFNRAQVWPWSAVYLGVRVTEHEVAVRVRRMQESGWEWFGAFPAFAIRAFHALRRLSTGVHGEANAPYRQVESVARRDFVVCRGRLPVAELRAFLNGESAALLEGFEREAAAYGGRDLACQNRVLNDLV